MLKRPNIFIVGTTKTGKTSLAKEIEGYKLISGSEWVKAVFEPSSPDILPGSKQYLEEITEFSKGGLMQDPDLCINFIRSKYPIEEGGFVIEGLRNPRDFVSLFRPHIDTFIAINIAVPMVEPTQFEAAGVAAINEIVLWWVNQGLLSQKRAHWLGLQAITVGQPRPLVPSDLRTKDAIVLAPFRDIEEMLAFASHIEPKPVLVAEKEEVHANISPIPVYVLESVFQNEDPSTMGAVRRCSLFGVSSYPGHALTFQVMTNEGGVFSYVPLHRIRCHVRHSELPMLGHQDLTYANCPDTKFTIIRFETLRGLPCRAYFKHAGVWLDAEYVWTIDWHEKNDLAHLLKLANGQMALLPSHKIMFGPGVGELPKYKKLKHEWKVEGVRFKDD